jgi:hypothetical protein
MAHDVAPGEFQDDADASKNTTRSTMRTPIYGHNQKNVQKPHVRSISIRVSIKQSYICKLSTSQGPGQSPTSDGLTDLFGPPGGSVQVCCAFPFPTPRPSRRLPLHCGSAPRPACGQRAHARCAMGDARRLQGSCTLGQHVGQHHPGSLGGPPPINPD